MTTTICVNLLIFQLTLQAKKAAEDASKQALHASKQAADASKNTFEDFSYVSKSTIGDLTKTAKEAATKKGLMKIDNNSQGSKQCLAQCNLPIMHLSHMAVVKTSFLRLAVKLMA